ncbi:Flp family type IVb pilin [Devosia psychrophila]|jgi:pilus assembly protein Flp/PilA|uniref:Pilus assembly protein Flp/PilA n=1 Tax=Devosia psychrophila TaxID=728005 RepID=A0A1I1QTN1_9HYPH|nr:Flp family type IVb pilin [Devosia psychrophila]SFD25429.1 pilus assembly protein Flp/PilA [Devosia psychrophila]
MLVAKIKTFLGDEGGATAIEYALIATLIAMAIIASAIVLGDGIRGLFNNGTTEVLTTQTGKI